ncbi:MAG: type II secretion system protein [Candidatus Campbellbacteria bacterium]|nr:type II secretion system protein [Candidatus Campbellbacteria bacterium]
MKYTSKGFTLIELLVVVAIIAILSTILLSSFVNYRSRQALELATKEARQIFETARSQTLASTGDSSYGVFIDSDSFVLFEGGTYDPTDPDNTSFDLDSTVEISDVSLSPDTDTVTFERGTGEPSASGVIELSLTGASSASRSITISPTGIINSNE